MSGQTEELTTIRATVADVMRRIAPNPAALELFERGLRRDAVEYVTDVIRDHVIDGPANLTVTISALPHATWEQVDADEHPARNGLPLKKEWLTGLAPQIIVEYIADGEGAA